MGVRAGSSRMFFFTVFLTIEALIIAGARSIGRALIKFRITWTRTALSAGNSGTWESSTKRKNTRAIRGFGMGRRTAASPRACCHFYNATWCSTNSAQLQKRKKGGSEEPPVPVSEHFECSRISESTF